ncbi:FAD-binding domain-containing protein [Biscogniauxia marginata]|nr:FAD-binding domain-containing protein [Biscogniauxia marginata]
MRFSFLLQLTAWLGTYGARAVPLDVKGALTTTQWSPGSILSFPNSDQFNTVTERWTIFDPPTYVAAISPATESDVVKAVKVARDLNFPFLATGGRHGYGTSLGKLDKGLAIDLSQLDSVRVDAKAGTLTVGGGTRFRQIVDPVYNAGFEIQTGSCSCPGMIGATLGAGVGRYQGLHGLVIDALLSVRLVTAKGDLIEVSATSNPDLFWGIRGAGANFGVITSATYKLTPLVNDGQVMNVDFIIPAELTERYFEALAQFDGVMPPELATISLIHYNDTTNGTEILANWVYAGPEEDGRKVMQPIFDLNPPTAAVSMVPWNRLVTTAGFGLDPVFCEANVIRSIYTTNVRKLSAPTYRSMFEKMSEYFEQNPAGRGSSVELEIFPNQATVAVPDDETAYPWRDALGNMMFQFAWSDHGVADVSNALGRQLRSDFVATSGYDDISAYVSYAHGDERIEEIYGAKKLQRLAALKKAWDPNNAFAYNNALPTQYP